MEFNDWSLNFQLGMSIFGSFNSYSKLCISTEDPKSFDPQYRSLILFLGDWSDKLNITEDEMEGADFYELGSIVIRRGESEAKITLNEKNMKLAKERGLIIIGYGFTITKIYISGPKLAGFEPMKVIRNKEKEQTVKLFFSESASLFDNKVKFVNNYHNLNEKVKCTLSKEDDKVIECTGLFDFTGEYKLADDKGVYLSSLPINVEPASGEKYDINNLLENKVNLDDFRLLPTLYFPDTVLGDINQNSVLVIETDDYLLKPSYKTMYVFRGDSPSVILFNANEINASVGADGGITVPEGKSEIRINLNTLFGDFLNRGFSIRGYGFAVTSVYIE